MEKFVVDKRRGNERIIYRQDWTAYNTAQTNEQVLFMKLLADLCSHIDQSVYKFGRPRLPITEMIFSSALKIYSTFSLRRFIGLMNIAVEKGFIEKGCSYSTISNYMRNKQLLPILHKLIGISSLPLSAIENDFAVDSSGFSTSRFGRYFSFKHKRNLEYRKWIKAHVICGVKTNIVTAVEITENTANDSPQFKPLVKRTAENFQIREISGDKAYLSKCNLNLVASYGGTPFIPFKSNSNSKARGSSTWKKMYHYFQLNREEFLKHYHKRSNSETVFHMIKTKFRDSVRSKHDISQKNEILLKVLCHNICVLIQEMHEIGIRTESYNLQFV